MRGLPLGTTVQFAIRAILLGAVAVLLLGYAGPARGSGSAEAGEPAEPDPPAVPQDPLLGVIDSVKPFVEGLEEADRPLTDEDRKAIREARERLLAAIGDRAPADEPAGDDERAPRPVRRAQRLLERLAALDLLASLSSVVPVLQRLEQRPEPPTEAELAWARRMSDTLGAEADAVGQVAKSAPERRAVDEAQRLVRRLRALELLPDTFALGSRLEPLEDREGPPSADEVASLRSATDDLWIETEPFRTPDGEIEPLPAVSRTPDDLPRALPTWSLSRPPARRRHGTCWNGFVRRGTS